MWIVECPVGGALFPGAGHLESAVHCGPRGYIRRPNAHSPFSSKSRGMRDTGHSLSTVEYTRNGR